MQITDEQLETSIAALREWRNDKTTPIVCNNGGGWEPIAQPVWALNDCIYRIAPTQAQKDEEAFALHWKNSCGSVRDAFFAALAYARKGGNS